MKLAELLGSFAGQLTDRTVKEVAVEYEGNVAELNIKPLTAVVLTSLLAPQLSSVNMVNAPVIARERGVHVSETRHSEAVDYQTLIRVRVVTELGARTCAGTLFGSSRARLVEFDGIAMDAELAGTMLFLRNKDKPGFVGNLGRTLGEAGINIATMHLGRTAPGQDAVLLVQVDQPLDDLVLAQVCAVPDVLETKALRF
jgi:D-3-phosphoglycerate dehydrogenase